MPIPSHRVLEIPELLKAIFSFLYHDSNASNAQVCELWFNLALDELWGNIGSKGLCGIFAVLSPLKGEPDTGYEFERPPNSTGWKRFEKYASHVKRLSYDSKPKLKQSVFNEISRTRRRLEIFPNLQTLKWVAPLNLRLCTLFMHSGIRTFAISLSEKIPPKTLFEDIADRMPNVSHLNIYSNLRIRVIEEDLAHLFKKLLKLHTVTFPRFYSTTKIIEALSSLQYLSTIESPNTSEQGAGKRLDIQTFKPTLFPGAFSALRKISITANFNDAAQFINTLFSPNTITQFRIESDLVAETPHSINRLLSVVSKNCKLIRELALVSRRDLSEEPSLFNSDNSYYGDDDNSNPLSITLEALKPLFELTNLISFEIHHHYPLLLTQHNIELFASSFPAIETLILNPGPVEMAHSTLTLDALIPLARHCPRLKSFGLFMDASIIPEISSVAPPAPFKSPICLLVGASIADEYDSSTDAAIYLSQLLAPGSTLSSNFGWDDWENINDVLRRAVMRRRDLWDNIENLMTNLINVRAQERQRTRAIMKRELEDLRVRVVELQDLLG
ncbi:hypothetical protein HYPSUDRAFT_61590 [Hypholoma sublateritium FD-334 SS-4]|uniref:F-box domain-containing protein n=1 Tax=Hypholoma sublateritium (strain FD-334 SS-4) TaxID=945553 RepID=A0A0D2PD46_HYPSF|nr:hypothetical protein HYPSUDRAFT_61590 [Hypholoma sublateritium FD-334 SS-4]